MDWTDIVWQVVQASEERRTRPQEISGTSLARLRESARNTPGFQQPGAAAPSDLEVEALVAIHLLGPGLPTEPQDRDPFRPAIAKAIAEITRVGLSDPDRLLDLATSYGVGWRRHVVPHKKYWNGIWPRAYTRFHALARQCVQNALLGLARIGVWFPPPKPEPDILASELVFNLMEPESGPVSWPVWIFCEALHPEAANSEVATTVLGSGTEFAEMRHGMRVVLTTQSADISATCGTGERSFVQLGPGEVVEQIEIIGGDKKDRTWQDEWPRIVVLSLFEETRIGAPVVNRGERADGQPFVNVANAWETRLTAGNALELAGSVPMRVLKCACGNYRCRELHRLDSWDPNRVDAGYIAIVNAIAGQSDNEPQVAAAGYWRMVQQAAILQRNGGHSPSSLPLIAYLYSAINGWFGPLAMGSFVSGMLYDVVSRKGW